MKIHVKDIQKTSLGRGSSFTVATLDVPYYDFIAFDSRLPRPTPKPHHESLRMRVKLTRPDGSQIEPIASINLVGGSNPPARLLLLDLSPQDAPEGTEVELLRYEVCPATK